MTFMVEEIEYIYIILLGGGEGWVLSKVCGFFWIFIWFYDLY